MWDPSAVSTPRKALVALVAAPLALILVLVSAVAVAGIPMPPIEKSFFCDFDPPMST